MTDSTDIQILQELQKNGRISLRKISEKLEISPSTASKRFRQLKEEDIIKGFSPDLNFQKLGLELASISQIKADNKNPSKVKKELHKLDFIEKTYLVTGDTDIMALGRYKDRKEMNQSVTKLQEIEGVSESKTNLILEDTKERTNLERLVSNN